MTESITEKVPRKQILRRQFNEGFLGADGKFSITKILAFAAQLVLLYHLGKDFEVLVKNWESFTAVLTFLVAPDVFKKLLAMKYGNGNGHGHNRSEQ